MLCCNSNVVSRENLRLLRDSRERCAPCCVIFSRNMAAHCSCSCEKSRWFCKTIAFVTRLFCEEGRVNSRFLASNSAGFTRNFVGLGTPEAFITKFVVKHTCSLFLFWRSLLLVSGDLRPSLRLVFGKSPAFCEACCLIREILS